MQNRASHWPSFYNPNFYTNFDLPLINANHQFRRDCGGFQSAVAGSIFFAVLALAAGRSRR